ncbi:MAG: trehalose-6-phosphate synthase [Chloroflexi bacterium]|nr:trehalose-6-phosphate synthase [Chloroflexota bacterium]
MVAPSQRDREKAELIRLCEEMLGNRRLILLSNRGPVEHQLTADDQLQARRGTGGAVTALSSLVRSVDFTWVASAMGEGDRKVAEAAEGSSIKSPIPGQRLSLRYVVTPRRVYHKYYNVFCNPLLWFLQHYMWSSPYTPNIDAAVHDAWENGYTTVNKAFAEAVITEAQGQDEPPYVMIHDYHLYLVPLYVRQAIPEATISHFIHIPWPSPAYWLLLPSYIRNAICRALCQCDILGFQSARDARAFLETCEEFLQDAVVDHVNHTVSLDGRMVRVKAYPISIDADELRRIASSPRSLDYERRLEPLLLEKTIVRVDRLEPSKNIVRGFRAYYLLLERYPELHGKVTFLAFLAPSRTRVRQYQRYAEEVEQQAQAVNKTFGTDDWKPLHVFYENNYTQAVAGLRLYDVLLVNSVIDGMNLVAKEGPVVNTREGVVILSESVGAYDQLRKGVLSVSPTDIEGTMQAMYRAVTMSADERTSRSSILTAAVENEDVTHWLKTQIQAMMDVN